MAYSCCFSLRGNLDFFRFPPKKYYNINYWSDVNRVSFHVMSIVCHLYFQKGPKRIFNLNVCHNYFNLNDERSKTISQESIFRKVTNHWAVFVAQFIKQLLSTQEAHGSNLVKGKILYRKDENKEKTGLVCIAHLKYLQIIFIKFCSIYFYLDDDHVISC